jgi:L,D-transpeptidase YbiS
VETAAGPDGAGRRFSVSPVRLALAAVILLFLAALTAGTGYRYEPYSEQPLMVSSDVPSDARPLQQYTARLRGRQRTLSARLDALVPKGVYIVIDQTQNRLYLKRGSETLLQAICSAGSGMVLRESSGKKREWVFDSPRGRFEVRTMLRDPVWRKPDWAFVEEGQPIPRNPADRLDYGTLGEYALYFGDGFMIHGTLYERLLGRAVSHGCIRVGRDDLRKVWANSRIGTQIFIY